MKNIAQVFFGLTIFLWSSLSNAETFQVTTFADTIEPCVVGSCSLRGAIRAANAIPGADTIEVPGGTYQLALPGPNEDAAATGDLDITDAVTIRGVAPGGPATIIGDGSDRVFQVFLPGSGVATLEDLAITGGAPNDLGGGILALTANLIVRRCFILGNAAVDRGGGVMVGIGDFEIVDSTISGNSSTQRGGGIDRLSVGTSTNLLVINSTISGNTAVNGGGIAGEGPGIMELIHTTLAENSATFGSALASGNTPQGSVRIRNSLIWGSCSTSVPPVSEGGNVEGPGATCNLIAPSDQAGLAELGLEPLAANGHAVWTHGLLPESPAIDAATEPCEKADQRGLPRPLDGDNDGLPACDAGAFERAPDGNILPVPGLTPSGIFVLVLALGGAGCWLARPR